MQKDFPNEISVTKSLATSNEPLFFWIIVSLINVVLHVVVLLNSHEYYWVVYTSIGWYFVFGIAGILQYFHRKFVFVKSTKNV